MTKPATLGSFSKRRITDRISSFMSSCRAFIASGRRRVMTFHVAQVVDQDVAQEALVGIEGPRRHRHAGAFAAQADQRLAGGLSPRLRISPAGRA
jgi:hypothetical protein